MSHPGDNDYFFVAGDDDDATYELSTFLHNRKILFQRRGPATVTWSMDGRGAKAAQIIELEHDLKVYRNGVKIFRGRIGPSTDEIGTKHTTQMGAFDYRGRLEYRLVKDGWTTAYFSTEQGTIAWNLINAAQAESNGGEGITQGSTTTGVTKDHGFAVGDTIAEVIDTIAETDDGFDWEITPAMVFNIYNPKMGSAKNEPLDFGGAVFSASRRLKNNDFANFVIGMGSGFLIPEELATAGIASDPRGRWERVVSWPNVEVQAQNDGRTQFLLDEVSTREFSYRLKLRRGWWTDSSRLWLGDEFTLRIDSGRIDIEETVTIDEILITLDDDGGETVEVIAA